MYQEIHPFGQLVIAVSNHLFPDAHFQGSFCECRFCDCESGDYYHDEDYEYAEDEADSEANGFMPDYRNQGSTDYPDYSGLLQLNSSGDSCNCDFCQCQHGFGIEDPPLEPLIHVSPRK